MKKQRKPLTPKAVALLALKKLRLHISAHINRINEIPDDAVSIMLDPNMYSHVVLATGVDGQYTLLHTWGKARLECNDASFNHIVTVMGDIVTKEAGR